MTSEDGAAKPLGLDFKRQSYKEAEMFRPGLKIPPFELCVVMRWSGLGDCIQRMPALFYLYDNAPHVAMYVFVYDYLLELFKHVFKKEKDRIFLMPISAYEEWIKNDSNKNIPYVDYTPRQVSASKTHLTEYGYLEVVKRVPPRGELWNIPKLNLTNINVNKYNLPKRYGVIALGVTSSVREWPAPEALETAKWMLQNNITPVYLGKKENPLGKIEGQTKTLQAQFNENGLHPNGLDLRNQTSLLEAAKIIDSSMFIAGVDNGLINLAYMTKAPVAVGFTSIKPEDRVPFREGKQFDKTVVIEPDKELSCKFCETLQPYVASKKHGRYLPHDYKHCIYSDRLCTSQMRASKFISAIKEIISHDLLGARQRRAGE